MDKIAYKQKIKCGKTAKNAARHEKLFAFFEKAVESNNLDDLELQIINNWSNIKIQNQKKINLKNIDQYSWKNIARDYLSNFESILK